MRVDEVEGIGASYAAKLSAADVKTVDDLLSAGAKPGGREKLAQQVGVSTQRILEWVNRVDLMRVPGVGSEYSDVLEAVGVDSPVELARRNATNLAAAIQTYVAGHPSVVRRTPSETTVADWIAAAEKLPKVVEH
jgi:predicted flap endonuclease-1-like 5' DNA nuclease